MTEIDSLFKETKADYRGAAAPNKRKLMVLLIGMFEFIVCINQIGTVRKRTFLISLQLMNKTLRQVLSEKQLLLHTNTDG